MTANTTAVPQRATVPRVTAPEGVMSPLAMQLADEMNGTHRMTPAARLDLVQRLRSPTDDAGNPLPPFITEEQARELLEPRYDDRPTIKDVAAPPPHERERTMATKKKAVAKKTGKRTTKTIAKGAPKLAKRATKKRAAKKVTKP